jgi:hypothetical protein
MNTIPVLARLLGDGNKIIERTAVELVGKLATHGECQVKNRCSAANQALKLSFVRPSRA